MDVIPVSAFRGWRYVKGIAGNSVFCVDPNEVESRIITTEESQELRVVSDVCYLHTNKPLSESSLKAYIKGKESFVLNWPGPYPSEKIFNKCANM